MCPRKSEPLRAAIVGCGDVAGGYDEHARDGSVFTHAGSYRRHRERIRLAACVEPDARRREAFRKAWRVPQGFSTVEELLSAGSYDIVSLCTPDKLHESQLRALIASGRAKMIWAEKPLTTSARSARAVLKLARKRGVGIRLSNHRRWEPEHLRLARDLRDGAIGKIVGFNARYVKGITHIGCTMIDTLRLLLGEPRTVQAVPPFDAGSYPGDPSISFLADFGGASGIVHGVDRDRYVYSLFEIEVVGSTGRARLIDSGERFELQRGRADRRHGWHGELGEPAVRTTKLSQAFPRGLELMLRDLVAGRARGVSEAANGLRDLEIVEAVKRSAALGGRAVRVP